MTYNRNLFSHRKSASVSWGENHDAGRAMLPLEALGRPSFLLAAKGLPALLLLAATTLPPPPLSSGTLSSLCPSILPLPSSFFFFFFFVFLRPHSWHTEVPRIEVELELKLWAYTTGTATPDPSFVCDLHHSSRQGWIFFSFLNLFCIEYS